MINIQNIDDNECSKWCLVMYLHHADYNPARIAKADEDFSKTVDFKDTKFPVKTRDIHKIEKKKNSISISVFVYKNKEKYPINVSKNAVKINMLIYYSLENKSKGTIFLSKILIHLCMIIHSCCYLQAFRTAEKVRC